MRAVRAGNRFAAGLFLINRLEFRGHPWNGKHHRLSPDRWHLPVGSGGDHPASQCGRRHLNLTAQDGAQAISVTEQVQGATTTKAATGTNAVLTSRCPEGIHFGNTCRVDYQVTVPARVTVDIEGAAGDITLTGPLTNATVNTSAARITGTGLGAGTIQATTNAGQVDLSFAAAPASVQVKTDAGKVTLTVPGTDKYNVTVNTTIGSQDVSVDKDPSSAHRIEVTATIGAVTVKKA